MYRKLLYVKLQWNKTSLSHIDTSVNCLPVLFNHKFIHFDTVWSDNLSILDHTSNLPGVQGLIFESWINIRKVGSISNFHHLLSFAHATCFSNNNMWWHLFHHQLKSNKKLNKVLISDTLKKTNINSYTQRIQQISSSRYNKSKYLHKWNNGHFLAFSLQLQLCLLCKLDAFYTSTFLWKKTQCCELVISTIVIT